MNIVMPSMTRILFLTMYFFITWQTFHIEGNKLVHLYSLSLSVNTEHAHYLT